MKHLALSLKTIENDVVLLPRSAVDPQWRCRPMVVALRIRLRNPKKGYR